MSSYRSVYEWTLETWKHQREDMRNLADKARGFIVVVGFVFGYSVFNASGLLESLQSVMGPGWLFNITGGLFGLYYLCFAVALVLSLLALTLTPLQHPHLEEVEPFRQGGPTQAELDRFHHALAVLLRESIEKNEPTIKRQTRFLTITLWGLIIGTVSLTLAGGLFAGVTILR